MLHEALAVAHGHGAVRVKVRDQVTEQKVGNRSCSYRECIDVVIWSQQAWMLMNDEAAVAAANDRRWGLARLHVFGTEVLASMTVQC